MATAQQRSSHQAVYRACMKEAAAQGRVLMQRLVGRAVNMMPRRAALSPDEPERKLLTEAALTLRKHENALCEAYPQALLAEFAQAIAGDARDPALSFDSLELMGDDQMQENVELMRVQQIVFSHVEAELAGLNALVCSAQGLNRVQVERNPLRPEAYVRSLRSVVHQSPVPATTRTRWLQHLGEALGPELVRIYQELGSVLRAGGVTEARFDAVPAAEPPTAARAAPAAGPGPANPSALLNLRQLRRLLSGNFEQPDESGDDASETSARPVEFSGTVPAAFEALEEMKQVDQVLKRLRVRQERERAHGNSLTEIQPRAAAQALAQEVVGLMVDNIASDRRLLGPVQQSVRDLEPALMRLAMDDPRFFSDRRHPARQLLEQMTQRSLAWDTADAPGFVAFIEPLQQAVEVLLSTSVTGAEPFDFALKTLEEAWGDAQQRDRRHRERAVRALLQAEQRNLLAEKIAKEMRARLDVAAAPREIAGFVAGPWSQVMAQARLADTTGAADPGDYAALVADLVWSAQPRAAAANTARLMKLVPMLIEKVRHGLATVDYPAPSTQRFLDYLAHIHRQALGTGNASGRPVSLATSMTREELEALLGDEPEHAGSWLGPTEAQQSGFMHTHQTLAPKPLFQETQPASFSSTLPPVDDAGPALPDVALQPGAWVEMMLDGGWARYQVTWASPHGTLFMFASAAGKSHSMTRRLLGKMRQGGTLRMISGQAVVDGALDAVAHAALRNSLDVKL